MIHSVKTVFIEQFNLSRNPVIADIYPLELNNHLQIAQIAFVLYSLQTPILSFKRIAH